MDIILKNVEVNTGYIAFEYPVCGVDVHVHGYEDNDEIHWMIKAIVRYQSDETSKMIGGRCRVCGIKE